MKKLYPLLSVLFLIYWGCEEQDSTPPTVTITSPQSGSTVSDSVTITCMSSDNESVEKVELWVNGVSTGVTDNTEPYSLEWNTTIYEDGSYHQESIHLYHDVHKEMKVNHTLVSILSVVFGLLGISMAYYLYIVKPSSINKLYRKMSRIKLYQISYNMKITSNLIQGDLNIISTVAHALLRPGKNYMSSYLRPIYFIN